MMTVYQYSGTVDGFLSVVFDSYATHRRADYIFAKGESVQFPLSCQVVEVKDDEHKAFRVEEGLIRKAGVGVMQDFLYAFASSEPEKSIVLYRWIVQVLQYGSDVAQMYAHPDVLRLRQTVDRVTKECHRLLGFLRFRELENGILYGEISPDHDVLNFLMPHFAERFRTEAFIIHDRYRGLFGVYKDRKWTVIQNPAKLQAEFSSMEKACQKLWDTYYQSVSIESRKNNRLRDNWMPRRYWKDLVEFVK